MNLIDSIEESKLEITLYREPLDTLVLKISKTNGMDDGSVQLFLTNVSTKETYGITLIENDLISIVERLATYYSIS